MVNPTGFILPAASLGLNSITVRPRRGFFRAGTKVPFVRIPQATVEEVHHDELEITDHPVEQQAAITDHAFKRPAEVVITAAWSNSPSPTNSLTKQAMGIAAAVLGTPGRIVIGAAANVDRAVNVVRTGDIGSLLIGADTQQIRNIYYLLLQLQVDRVLFDVYTGKRPYMNMLMKSLTVRTSAPTENSLWLTAVCRQVIMATTSTVSAIVPINVRAQALPEKTTPVTDQGRRNLTSSDLTIETIQSLPEPTPEVTP